MHAFWDLKPSKNRALIIPSGPVITYTGLGERTAEFQARLSPPRGLLGIQCDGDVRQYIAYLASLRAGFPVVLMGERQSAHSTGLTLRYLYEPRTDQLRVVAPDSPAVHPDLAVLLSTSGSTGTAKWVRLSHRNIAANAASIAEYLELTSADRAPLALPFQYSYGMSVLNSHLSVAAALVLTEGSVTEPDFWRWFEEAGCTSLAGVPHTFELLSQAGARTSHLGALRYMTQAGGRLAPSKVSEWVERGRTEGWRFFVMYGQTEASPRISYMTPEQALETPAAIGRAIPGGEIWIADENGRPVPDGTEGELYYRGPNTMMGYAERDADLSLGQGPDILKTGDMARRHPSGVFEIVGRRSRFVKLFGYRVGLDEIEKHLHERGYEAACGAQGDALHVFVSTPGPTRSDSPEVASHLGQWLGIPSRAFRVHAVEAIPRLSSGKVDNRAVAGWIAERASENGSNEPDPSVRAQSRGAVRSVESVFRAHFPADEVHRDASFNGLGGDSLTYLSLAVDLEKVIGSLPEEWPDLSIGQLEAQRGLSGRRLISLDTPTVLRGVAIMLVVAGHFGVLRYGGGGAVALLMIVGWSLSAFTVPNVLQTRSIVPVVTLAVRVGLLTLAYGLANYLLTGWGDVRALLFISNWISPELPGSAWFIDVYLQLLGVLALVLAIPIVRTVLRRDLFRTTLVAAAFGVVGAAVADILVDTHYLYRRLPHLMAWILLAGMSARAAATHSQRLLVTAVVFVGVFQAEGYAFPSGYFLLVAALAMIWLRGVPVPWVLGAPLRYVASASLMIYLTHYQFRAIVGRLFPDLPVVAWGGAILGGTLAWKVYEPLDAFLSRGLNRLFLRAGIAAGEERERGDGGTL